MMLNVRLRELPAGDVRDLLDELEQVKGLSVAGHAEMTLLGYLDLCQKDSVRNKREAIQAANFYNGSLLKTRIENLPKGDSLRLVEGLCEQFRVSKEVIGRKTLYVFLNEILNVKSKLRKPPPFRL